MSGSSRSGIHGELICCSEGKTKKDPNTLNSYFRSTQPWEQTCLSERLLVSEPSTMSLTIIFSVRLGVFTICEQ